MSSPITSESLAALPPEFRALLQSVIDHDERRLAELVAAAEHAASSRPPHAAEGEIEAEAR